MRTDTGAMAEVRYDGKGADLRLGGKALARVDGVARLVTAKDGTLSALTGIAERPQEIVLRTRGQLRNFHLCGTQTVSL